MSTSNTPAVSHSASPAPEAGRRHVLTAVERQRSQLERLLKDPSKPAYVPPPPKDKIIRPAREMMKNVQGSSAGAGSGEFHVYKASRRREYERLKMMEDESRQEAETAEFERKRKEADGAAEARTAKNRAKRQKKKDRAKGKTSDGKDGAQDAPLKKRRLINGKELVFRKPGEESDEEQMDEVVDDEVDLPEVAEAEQEAPQEAPRIAQEQQIIIHEDD